MCDCYIMRCTISYCRFLLRAPSTDVAGLNKLRPAASKLQSDDVSLVNVEVTPTCL
jgi:hypothetical protein